MAVEQIIKIKAPKAAALYKALSIIACIVSAITIPSSGLLGLVLVVVFVLFTIFLFRYYNAEYEYSLNDGELNVARIMARTSRKQCGTYNISKATLVARPDSQDALRLEHMDYRTNNYVSSDADKSDIVVIYTYNANNEMERIYLQPDERLISAIEECVARGVSKL